MYGLILAALTIIIPLIGMFLGLIFSQINDSFAAEGRTRDWLLFFLIFLPTAIISFILISNIHSDISYSITWLPKLIIGIRINQIAIVFSCIVANLSALLALYSITHMSQDSHRGRYWFFFQLTLTAMMMSIFSNNLFWMFGSFEIASLSAFFLISHWHRKTGEEGKKAGYAAIRFFLMNILGDVFLLIGFSFLMTAFNTSLIEDIIENWFNAPTVIIGKSTVTTRTLIKIFILIGSLIKSSQIPLLLWPINGQKQDNDLSKAPIPVSAFLISTTFGNIGLYILSIFMPLFMSKNVEIGTGAIIYTNFPFLFIGWFAIITLLIIIGYMFTSININRIIIGSSVAQLSYSFLGLSAGNTVGYAASIMHIITSAPTCIAIFILFGIINESLKITDASKLSGLKNRYPLLQYLGLISLLCYSGIFPTSVYFSKDMIFSSLRGSLIPSKYALLFFAIITSLLIFFAILRSFMKIFYGSFNTNYSSRPLNVQSIICQILALGWALLSGLVIILVGYPRNRFFSGLETKIILKYDSPFFSNWAVSITTLFLLVGVFITTYLIYRKGHGPSLKKIQNIKAIKKFGGFFENGLYLDYIYEKVLFQPINFLSKFFAWTRLKSYFAGLIFAILSLILLVLIMIIVGGF